MPVKTQPRRELWQDPSLAPPISRGTQVRLFFTLWLVYLVHWSPFVVRELYLTISLAERGTVRVDPYVDLHPDLFTLEGRGSYLGGNPGASLVAVVPYWLTLPVINRVAPVRPLPPEEHPTLGEGYKEDRTNKLRFYRRAREMGILMRLAVGALVTSGFCMAPLTALAVVTLLQLLGRMGLARGPALWMAVLCGLGTPFFLRAGTLSLNLLVALCTLWAFALLWRPEEERAEEAAARARQRAFDEEETKRFGSAALHGKLRMSSATGRDDTTVRTTKALLDEEETVEVRSTPRPPKRGGPERLRHFAAGFFAGWAILTDYTGAVTAGMLGMFVIWQQFRRKSFGGAVGATLWFVAGALGPIAILFYYQWVCYGNPWLPAQFHMPRKIFAGYPSEHGFGWPLPAALWGLLFDPQYGLLVFSPLFAVALYHPVLVWKKRNRVPGRIAVFAWAFFAALYIFCSMIHYTVRHQWQDGVRYLVPALPLLVLLVADVLARARRWLVVLITVLAVGESWAIAMVRESPYESLRRVLTEGLQYPWLTTLEKAAMDIFPPLADPASHWAALLPWGVLLALLVCVWLIWIAPPREASPDARESWAE